MNLARGVVRDQVSRTLLWCWHRRPDASTAHTGLTLRSWPGSAFPRREFLVTEEVGHRLAVANAGQGTTLGRSSPADVVEQAEGLNTGGSKRHPR